MKSYAERQRSFACKVGDTVKIFKKPDAHDCIDWQGGWVEDMDRCLGRTGKVVKIGDSGIFVRVTDVLGPLTDGSWIWPYTSLDIIR